MNVFALDDGDKRWPMISRVKTFYTADIKLPNIDASRYISTIVPDTASIRDVIDGQLIIFLNQPWANIPEGSLVSLSLKDMSADRKVPIVTAMTPTKAQRSEEHTSELQSIMRISYAGCCLKKKINQSR